MRHDPEQHRRPVPVRRPGHLLLPEPVPEPGQLQLLHVLHQGRHPQVLPLQDVRQPGGVRALRHRAGLGLPLQERKLGADDLTSMESSN